MPGLTVRLLRVSLAALLAGAALGAWLLAAAPWSSAWLPRVRAAHVHLMLFGWVVPFVLGTAYWILPRHAAGEPRGSPPLAQAAAAMLHTGVLMAAGGALARLPAVERGGVGLVLAGTAIFGTLLWPRVRAYGTGAAPNG